MIADRKEALAVFAVPPDMQVSKISSIIGNADQQFAIRYSLVWLPQKHEPRDKSMHRSSNPISRHLWLPNRALTKSGRRISSTPGLAAPCRDACVTWLPEELVWYSRRGGYSQIQKITARNTHIHLPPLTRSIQLLPCDGPVCRIRLVERYVRLPHRSRADFTPAPSPRSLCLHGLFVASAAPIFTTPTATDPSASGFTHISKSPVLTGDACSAQGVLIHGDDLRFIRISFVATGHAANVAAANGAAVYAPQAHMGPLFIIGHMAVDRSRACRIDSNGPSQMGRAVGISFFVMFLDHAVP